MAQELKTDLVSPANGSSPLPRMTFEEFLEWSDEDTFAEWVDGEVILMSPVSTQHQLLAAFLAALLRFFAEANNRGLVLTAPFLMKLAVRPQAASRMYFLLLVSDLATSRMFIWMGRRIWQLKSSALKAGRVIAR